MGDNHKYRCVAKHEQEMVRMAESVERKHICPVCGKGFNTKQHLTRHTVVHSKVKPFKCDADQCDKSYGSAATLLQHKEEAHLGVMHECLECGRRFGVKSNMTRHYKDVHGEEKPFKCPKCGVQFAQKTALSRHIETVHDKLRAFKCEHCGKSFGQACDRKTHIEIVHFNIRFSCAWPDCTFTTGQKGYVKYHRRRAHTQEWSLECQLCEDQMDIWWGCIFPGEMDKHKAKRHPVEWYEEQQAYMKTNPFVCKYRACLNRFESEVEKERHERKMH